MFSMSEDETVSDKRFDMIDQKLDKIYDLRIETESRLTELETKQTSIIFGIRSVIGTVLATLGSVVVYLLTGD